MDAFPRTYIDAPLAQNALRLIDMDELFRFHRPGKVPGINRDEIVGVTVRHHRRICVSTGHD